MQTPGLAASAILLLSTAVVGVMMAPVLREGLRADDYSDADLGQNPFNEWVAAMTTFVLVGVSMDATFRWLEHYQRTGQAMSVEELERSYE